MYTVFDQLLKSKGISVYYVAKETGISYPTFTNWKRGKFQPREETLKRIADFLEVSMEYLKGEESTIQCSVCHHRYDPAKVRSLTAHDQFHQKFIAAQDSYGMKIPSLEDAMVRQANHFAAVRDIKYDKDRRIAEFRRYVKYSFICLLYDSNFKEGIDIDEYAKQQADVLRPSASISLNMVNAIRDEYDLPPYVEDLKVDVSDKEYDLLCKYRELPEVLQKVIDMILDGEYEQ